MEKLTVYIVEKDYEYEGSEIIGVFYSEEKANAVRDKMRAEQSESQRDSTLILVTQYVVK